MNLKANHRIDEDGKHHVFIEGLRVWVHQSGGNWVAQGIDIDYATSAESGELAAQAFLLGFYMTIGEHLKRFKSLERLISKRPPDDIYKAWLRELECQRLELRQVYFDPQERLVGDPEADISSLGILPHALKFFESVASPGSI